MNDFITKIQQNKRIVTIVIAALMLVFFTLCSAIDIAGKAQVNGLQLIFKGKGLGFARFVSLLMVLVPIFAIVAQFVDIKLKKELKDNLSGICFAASVALALTLAACLGSGISLAWGSWFYMLTAIAGVLVSYIHKFAGK